VADSRPFSAFEQFVKSSHKGQRHLMASQLDEMFDLYAVIDGCPLSSRGCLYGLKLSVLH